VNKSKTDCVDFFLELALGQAGLDESKSPVDPPLHTAAHLVTRYLQTKSLLSVSTWDLINEYCSLRGRIVAFICAINHSHELILRLLLK